MRDKCTIQSHRNQHKHMGEHIRQDYECGKSGVHMSRHWMWHGRSTLNKTMNVAWAEYTHQDYERGMGGVHTPRLWTWHVIANKFAHQFTPPPIRLTSDKSKRQLTRQFHQLPLTGTLTFTPADIKEAIRLAKSPTAIGPDGMSTHHLKKLAQRATNYLTNILNLSISTGQIPEIWHKAIIIPIPKPGKDNNIGMNWRPISLLCPAAKTLEKLQLPKILTHIPFHPAQHGLRPRHSTSNALTTITVDIAACFSRKKPAHRTVLVALDLTAAFDNVDHLLLLDFVFNTNIPATIRRWLHNYMQNRRAKVHFRQKESKSRKVKTGVVQGGVLSPALFKGEDMSGTRRSSVSSALQRWRQEWYKEEFCL